MRFLLDTNIIIAAEPTASNDVEAGSEIVVELMKLAHAGGHQLQIHPATVEEIGKDKDVARRDLRLSLKSIQLSHSLQQPIRHSKCSSVLKIQANTRWSI